MKAAITNTLGINYNKAIFRNYFFILAFISFFPLKGVASITVFFIKGKVEVLENTKSKKIILQIGNTIKKGNNLLLYPNSEIILRNHTGKSIIFTTLSKPLNIPYTDITTQFTKTDEGLLSSLFIFLRKQIKKDKFDLRDYAEENLKVYGGVIRANCRESIMQYPGFDAKLVLKDINFQWETNSEVDSFVFEIYPGPSFNPVKAALYRTVVADNSHLLSAAFLKNTLTVRGDSVFNWVVYPKQEKDHCTRYSFTLVDYYLNSDFLENVQKLASKQKNQYDKLLMSAFIFEQNRLLIEANNIYIQMYARFNKDEIKEFYELFLARNGMYGKVNLQMTSN